MTKGTVCWFNAGKGYGFIAPQDGGQDVFTHYSSIERSGGYKTLRRGQRVEFEIQDNPRGPQATRVWPARDGPRDSTRGSA